MREFLLQIFEEKCKERNGILLDGYCYTNEVIREYGNNIL